MNLITSNKNKIKEYSRFGLKDIQPTKGFDLPEVDADAYTVCKYKSYEAGANCLVEDTSFDIEGADIGVNIRWLKEEVPKHSGKRAVWKVIIGKNDGKEITLYVGEIHGVITDKFAGQGLGFGFDSYFIPDGSDKTLYELDELGIKDSFSARKEAINKLLKGSYSAIYQVRKIKKWTGKMQ